MTSLEPQIKLLNIDFKIVIFSKNVISYNLIISSVEEVVHGNPLGLVEGGDFKLAKLIRQEELTAKKYFSRGFMFYFQQVVGPH